MDTINIIVDTTNEYVLDEILELKEINDHCGLTTKKYSLKNEFGVGEVISWNFEGLMVRKREFIFKKPIKFKGFYEIDSLVYSVLLKGEKKLFVPNPKIELIQEEMESCISFINKTNGYIAYPKNITIKEIVIKMSHEFIKKHSLSSSFPIHENYAIENLRENFTNQLDYKTENIIYEIVSDNKSGLLKRLFLESKALELLILQFDNQNKGINNSTTLKKIYLVRDLITNNLHMQYSVNELSKKVFLNEFLLKKEFKKTFGITIFEFALQERMKEAKNLLINSTKPIYEIAELVGYKNPTHFSAAFKKIEKITPKQFRNKEQ